MATYNVDGQINLTASDGSTYTGRNNPDGSWNIVINDGSTYTGFHHPSGGINAVITTSEAVASHPNGSMFVILQTDGVGYTPVG